MTNLEFKFLINREIRAPNQDRNFEYFYRYREHLQRVADTLCWKAIFRTLGGVQLIGAYYSFNAAIVSHAGSLVNVIFNCDAPGPDGYQQGIIISDEESVARQDLSTLEVQMKEIHPAYFLEIGKPLTADRQRFLPLPTERVIDIA